jgi:hypothetical protein
VLEALKGTEMRTTLLATIVAAILTAPAYAQGQLPRPGQDIPSTPRKAAPLSPQRQAQQPVPPPPAPYTALKVAPPKPYDDPSLAAFRTEVAAVARRKDRGALARLVLVKDFFWLKEEGNAAGKMTGIEALATALGLAAKDGTGWETLGEFVADDSAIAYADRPNTVCSPAGPRFDIQDLEVLAAATRTDVGDWGFTSSEGVEVHATAHNNSPVIETLGMEFVWVMPDLAPNASQDFMRVVAPSGRVGFVPAEAINPLGSDQLCYGKDASGAWKIVGMIGGG